MMMVLMDRYLQCSKKKTKPQKPQANRSVFVHELIHSFLIQKHFFALRLICKLCYGPWSIFPDRQKSGWTDKQTDSQNRLFD